MTEEYYEKHQMEEDLGTEIAPPTEEELDEMATEESIYIWGGKE